MLSGLKSTDRTSSEDWSRRLAFFFLVLTAAASMLSVAVSQIALGLSLVFLLTGWLRGRRPSTTGLEWPAGLLLLWALLMIPFSPDPLDSLIHARRFYLFSALWLGTSLVDTDRRRWIILLAFTAAAVANVIYSLLTEILIPADYDRRIRLIQHSVSTGSWLMMCATLLLASMLATAKGLRRRLLWLAALASPLIAVILSQTRGAWLGLLAGVLLILLLVRKRYLPVLVLVVITAMLLAPDGYKTRLRAILDMSSGTTQQRVVMWRGGVELIRDNPLIGVGDRNLSDISPEISNSHRTLRLPHLHSNLIMIGVIWGIPGLILGLWLMLKTLLVLYGRWRESAGTAPAQDSLHRGWLLAGLTIWAGVNVAGIFDWTFGDPELSLVYFLCIGIGLSRPSDGRLQA